MALTQGQLNQLANKPVHCHVFPKDLQNYDVIPGMSIRDWYAGLALQGVLTMYTVTASVGAENMPDPAKVAKQVKAYADALVKELAT